jgi:hypothetical protein
VTLLESNSNNSFYLNDKKLNDELVYVMNRKEAVKRGQFFIGNNLTRP